MQISNRQYLPDEASAVGIIPRILKFLNFSNAAAERWFAIKFMNLQFLLQ